MHINSYSKRFICFTEGNLEISHKYNYTAKTNPTDILGKVSKNSCARKFTRALRVIENLTLLKCPSTGNWLNKLYIT